MFVFAFKKKYRFPVKTEKYIIVRGIFFERQRRYFCKILKSKIKDLIIATTNSKDNKRKRRNSKNFKIKRNSNLDKLMWN